MLAIFDNLGFSELLIVVVAAVLIFGKRLPEVASQAGMQIAKFRRSLQDIKNETGIDNDIRKIQREIQEAVPRDLSVGEMARIASLELEKRMKANEEPKPKAPDASAAQMSSAEASSSSPSESASTPSSAESHGSTSHHAPPDPHAPSTNHAPSTETNHHASPHASPHAPTDATPDAPAPDALSHDTGGHPAH